MHPSLLPFPVCNTKNGRTTGPGGSVVRPHRCEPLHSRRRTRGPASTPRHSMLGYLLGTRKLVSPNFPRANACATGRVALVYGTYWGSTPPRRVARALGSREPGVIIPPGRRLRPFLCLAVRIFLQEVVPHERVSHPVRLQALG